MIFLDCETELIGAGRVAPRIACVTIGGFEPPTVHKPARGVETLKRWNEEGFLVGHNIAFDLGCLVRFDPRLAPLVWRWYDEGKIWDLGIHERLFALAMGWGLHPQIGKPIISAGVSLASLAKGLLGIEIGESKTNKNAPRLRYGEVVDTPLNEWPSDFLEYAIEDVRITRQVFVCQYARLKKSGLPTHGEGDRLELPSQSLQVRSAWALHHLSAWGLRADPLKVDTWRADLATKKESYRLGLERAQVLRPNGKRDLKKIRALVESAYAGNPPLTEKGSVSTSNEILEESGDPTLKNLAKWAGVDKLLNTFGSVLDRASSAPLCARWNVLVRSGRTSCTNPNLQQLPQKGGVRECFTPRPSKCYIGADYSTAELVALAQVQKNWGIPSEMGKAISRGEDLHLKLASELAGCSYADAIERKRAGDPKILQLRKLAKIPNFGLAGGLSAHGLLSYAKGGYGIELTLQECKDLVKSWFRTWPEMRAYFRGVEEITERGWARQEVTERIRGGVGFTDGANTFFQGLVADGAKFALYEVVRACFLLPESPLYGARPVLFVHDEIICEQDLKRAPAGAEELKRIMEESMKLFIPDLPITADPWCSMRWRKGLDPLRDERGELIVQM